jgi:hypothetical protein
MSADGVEAAVQSTAEIPSYVGLEPDILSEEEGIKLLMQMRSEE